MEKRKRGSGRKTAPPGYYMAQEARKKLGMNASTFGYYVRQGKIKRHIPPLRSEGFYKKEEIDQLAMELALFLHTDRETTTITRTAQPEDAPGIVDVLAVMGWQTATAQQRISWYKVNPYIDYIALWNDSVAGYIHAAPLEDKALEDMMSGKRRSWNLSPQDFLPYEPERRYSLYIGIATRKDVEHHTQRIGFRLISGFMTFLKELAEQQIFIHRLYAVSAEIEGQRLCRGLGFIQQPAQEGDLFPRFVLDLQSSDSHFARLYREAVQTIREVE